MLQFSGRSRCLRLTDFYGLRADAGDSKLSNPKETPVIHPHRHPPLLHLPMVLPQRSQSTMTEWLDLALNIVSLLPLFQTLPRSAPLPGISEFDGVSLPKKQKRPDVELPNAQFGSISYVRVYANCRLRRIWFVSALPICRIVATHTFASQLTCSCSPKLASGPCRIWTSENSPSLLRNHHERDLALQRCFGIISGSQRLPYR